VQGAKVEAYHRKRIQNKTHAQKLIKEEETKAISPKIPKGFACPRRWGKVSYRRN
jgi:hypothetical protein